MPALAVGAGWLGSDTDGDGGGDTAGGSVVPAVVEPLICAELGAPPPVKCAPRNTAPLTVMAPSRPPTSKPHPRSASRGAESSVRRGSKSSALGRSCFN